MIVRNAMRPDATAAGAPGRYPPPMSSDQHATSTPRVTVVIPTYNWAPVLPYSIGSVLAQTWTDFELLVVGDGCTDESAEVVGAIEDPRVTWVNLPENTGNQVGPNNEALRRARGDLMAYLGHDDLWLPRHLELLVRAAAAGPPGPVHSRCLFLPPGRTPELYPPLGYTYAPGVWLPPTSAAHPTAMARDLGVATRHLQTGTRDAESDLWERFALAGHPPRLVDRLTCVKLPAAYRRDVYRDRPSQEQAAWAARIAAADDPEVALRALVGSPDTIAPGSMQDVPMAIISDPGESAERRTAVRRQFKGLPPL